MDPVTLIEPVGDLLRAVADAAIRPRFRRLADAEVTEKSAGEIVTIADREAEVLIDAGLRALAPGVPVIGEEACAADASLVGSIPEVTRCWLVDPLDGTANFVAGSPDYAVMVALVDAGQPVAAWIWQPEHDLMWTAALGGGTRRNGALVHTAARPDDGTRRVAVLSRFLGEETRARVHARSTRFASVEEAPRCAGVTYPWLIEGRYDAVLFWRTLPWDHAAGALLLAEAGGSARRLDGSAYRPHEDRVGLLAVARAEAWPAVRDDLLGDEPAP